MVMQISSSVELIHGQEVLINPTRPQLGKELIE